jgi:integrase
MARPVAKVEGVYEREVGSGLWHARYRKDGKIVRKSFGRDRAAAIAWVEKARTLKREGGGDVPTSAKLPIRSAAEVAAAEATEKAAAERAARITLSTLADGLLAQIKANPKKYKDQKNPPQRIAKIKAAFGHRPAESIATPEIADWLGCLKVEPKTPAKSEGGSTARNVSAATQNRYKAVFSAIFSYGKRRGLIAVNPVRDVEPVAFDNGVIRWLRSAEEDRLRKVLQSDVDKCGPRNERLRKHMLHRICELDVALGTGMRKGEQYGLTWDDVDFEVLEIIARDTKNGTSRVVHMNKTVERAMRILKQMPMGRKRRSADIPNESPTNAVFSIGDNKNWWRSALRRAKVNDFRWHDLRHTFCSRLAQRGASLKLIQEAAGHKTIAISARYAHLDKRSLVQGLALLEDDY